jgi:hypothetical protein
MKQNTLLNPKKYSLDLQYYYHRSTQAKYFAWTFYSRSITNAYTKEINQTSITSNVARWHQEDSQCTMDPPKIYFIPIEKGCCKYLQQALHKSKSKWEKERRVGEEWERFGHSNSTLRIDV